MSKARGIRAGQAYVEVGVDNTAFVRGLKYAEHRLRKFGTDIQRIGQRLAIAGGAMATPFVISVNEFKTFDDQMRIVQAVTRATGKEFQLLTDKARALGRSTSFTADQVASGMVSLGRQGFSAAEIDASIQGVLNLARATGTDLGEAAMMASDTLRAFGMNAGEMTRVVDVLTATANNSAQTLDDLGQSMKYAAPIAQKYGSTLEETANALGILANVGIKGSLAGTGMRAAMSRLADPKIQGILKSLGVNFTLLNGDLREFTVIMRQIGKATEKWSTGSRLAILSQIFGRRALSASASLTTESFERLEKAIYDAGGTAQRTADIMDAGIGGSLRRMKSAYEDVKIAIGKSLEKPLIRAMDAIKDFANRVAGFIKENEGLVQIVALASVKIILLGGALIAAGVAVRTLAFGFTGLIMLTKGLILPLQLAAIAINVVVASFNVLLSLASPFGILAAAVAGLGVAFALSADKTVESAKGMKDEFGSLKGALTSALEEIGKAVKNGDMDTAFDLMWAAIKLVWAKGVAELKKLWANFKFDIVNYTLDMSDGMIDAMGSVLTAQKKIMGGFKKFRAGLTAAAAIDEAVKAHNEEIWAAGDRAAENKFGDKTGKRRKKIIKDRYDWERQQAKKAYKEDFNAAFGTPLSLKRAKLDASYASEGKVLERSDPAALGMKQRLKEQLDAIDKKENQALSDLGKDVISTKRTARDKYIKENIVDPINKSAKEQQSFIDDNTDKNIDKVKGFIGDMKKALEEERRIERDKTDTGIADAESEFTAALKKFEDSLNKATEASDEFARKKEEEAKAANMSEREKRQQRRQELRKEYEQSKQSERDIIDFIRGVKGSRRDPYNSPDMRKQLIGEELQQREQLKLEREKQKNIMDELRGRKAVEKEMKTPTDKFNEFMKKMGFRGLQPAMAKFNGSVAGSFSGFARFGKGGESSAANRTANATERISKSTEELLRIERERQLDEQGDAV